MMLNLVTKPLRQCCLNSASRLGRAVSYKVVYEETGNPKDVYKLVESTPDMQGLGPTEVRVRMLAAPINPADINLAEGKYGISVPLPAVGGNEGVGMVEEVGPLVRSLEPGNWIIPAVNAFGTWRTELTAEEKDLIRVPSDIGVASAATLSVNPGTAYRMLKDFGDLAPGDVVIQNGANSMVGLAVIQIAKKFGLKTINIVRSDRPDVDTVLRLLTNLGGDVNVPSDFVGTHQFNAMLAELPAISLGLNCVGGEYVADMARALAPNATLVSYGGMSKRPMSVPLDVLSSKQIKMRGFWVSRWYETHSRLERAEMMAALIAMIRARELTLFTQLHDFDDFSHALSLHMAPYQLRKVVLRVAFPDRMAEHDALPSDAYEVFETDTV